MDAELLSRIQFGFVVSFHILFPAFSIGLAAWLVFIEAMWLRKRTDVWRDLYFFWLKIFAVSFGIGVVTGIVMSFQFGTNWSKLSEAAGSVLGPLLNYEVLTAFFLEATFLGVMLFGWKRVSHRLHFIATCMVSLGTLISAFWIMSANSWMQTPTGFAIRHGVYVPTDWWKVIFNPALPLSYAHMVLAALLTTSMVVGGVSAWYLLRGRFPERSRLMLKAAVGFVALAIPLQIFVGDAAGQQILHTQPAKLAAIEANWTTGRGVPWTLFAWPDPENETNHAAIEIPRVGSLILTHQWDGQVPGLKSFPPQDRPPVAPTFFAFRVMVALGFAMLALAWFGAWRWWRGHLFDRRWYLRLWLWLSPAGFIALLAGWYTREIGRQPWVIYGFMRTDQAFSGVPLASVAISLTVFVLVYMVIFGFGLHYLLKLVRRGPVAAPPRPHDGAHTPARPLSAAPDAEDLP
ncbi:cytochrome ubiquinol oxidase subunit I [Oleiagrimonas sp. C23AA]|uniref:cytochrome ubiquinol oxidase subunit I n=1 Tax=Oleiagrimonas sp. C23AA TaxID=2719047 RepID=UPI00141E1A79|nr:cytochrome ubiquinol oxidase subunit I [Oleiagrimonas sp. C23AA]NII09783.1 cytochrome ubiquinol oxidase subunit I [Oleiagrimonas sp. C23AA]